MEGGGSKHAVQQIAKTTSLLSYMLLCMVPLVHAWFTSVQIILVMVTLDKAPKLIFRGVVKLINP